MAHIVIVYTFIYVSGFYLVLVMMLYNVQAHGIAFDRCTHQTNTTETEAASQPWLQLTIPVKLYLLNHNLRILNCIRCSVSLSPHQYNILRITT